MRIYEGQQATLNNIRISGNTRVYENVIRRELRTKPGDLFKKDAIMRSIRELANMQFFDPEKIEPDIKPDQENQDMDSIPISLKEELTYSLKPIVDPGPLFSSSLPQRKKKYEQDFL